MALHPLSLRVNDEDIAMLAYLKRRLSMGTTQVLRLALRRLVDLEKKLEKERG